MSAGNPVIAAFDGRSGGRDALALAVVLADALDTGAIAAFAFPSEASPSAVPREQLRDQAEAELAAAVAQVSAEPRTIATSSPARGLHELAEAEHAAAVVVGSSHRGPVSRVLAGSVAQRLLAGSSCPVVVASSGLADAGDPELRTVGVAFDGTPDAWAALQQGAKLAAGAGGSLRIIRAADPLDRDSAELELSHAAASVSTALQVETELVTGPAADALEREASRGLDLLVVGSRGFGPVLRVFLGSVGTELMRRAPCPVMVVPRSVEFDPSAGGLAARDQPAVGG
jgi:nucleotide-binding universal stress UspA family protein